ncbi:MAG: hypothetical protein ACYTEX_11240 [Planctomycetota bacterium]|jgi:hypothetical protein
MNAIQTVMLIDFAMLAGDNELAWTAYDFYLSGGENAHWSARRNRRHWLIRNMLDDACIMVCRFKWVRKTR